MQVPEELAPDAGGRDQAHGDRDSPRSSGAAEGLALVVAEGDAGRRPRAGLDHAVDQLAAPRCARRQAHPCAAIRAMASGAHSLDDRFDFGAPTWVVLTGPERQPGQAAHRRRHDVTADQPEDVLCSCCVDRRAHPPTILENEQAARGRGPHP
jgi:hypothetical protein